MDTIKIDDFQKIDIRIGVVLEAGEVEGSEKLIRQVVDFGAELGKRIIFSGIKKWYKPEDLIGKHLPYVVNLESRKMPGGEESQGMLVAASPKDENGKESASLFEVSKNVPPGTKVI
jgi:methionine--tRNA ligase beta chain